MNMDKYAIIMTDGQRVLTTGVNLSAVATILNTNNIAAKIGKKSMAKHLIVGIANVDTFDKSDDKNVVIKVGETLLYTKVTDADSMLNTLTDDINKKLFSLANNEILINRGAYQYAEVVEKNTESETETQAKA